MTFACMLNAGYDISFFDTKTPKSLVLSADPEQAIMGTSYIKCMDGSFGTKSFINLKFGGDSPLMKISAQYAQAAKNSQVLHDNSFSINIRGMVRSRFNLFSNSFNLYNIDYFGGLSFLMQGEWTKSNQFEVYIFHQSSHLGDDYINFDSIKKWENFSRESIRVLHYLSISKDFLVAYGFQAIIRKEPVLPSGTFTFQSGLYYDFFLFNHRCSTNLDLKLREERKWSAETNLQIGFDLFPGSKSETSNYVQSFIIEFYNGPTAMGQFSGAFEQYISLGFQAKL